jgi:hypothetical protein
LSGCVWEIGGIVASKTIREKGGQTGRFEGDFASVWKAWGREIFRDGAYGFILGMVAKYDAIVNIKWIECISPLTLSAPASRGAGNSRKKDRSEIRQMPTSG